MRNVPVKDAFIWDTSSGVPFFGGGPTTDSLVYGAALQSIEYFSDQDIIETGADEDYEKKDDTMTGLLLNLTYKF